MQYYTIIYYIRQYCSICTISYKIILLCTIFIERYVPTGHEAQTKLREIVEFEELARMIMLEGTFWKYNKVTAPGDNDKFLLDNATEQQAIEELARIAKILADASYGKDKKVSKKW